MKRIKNIVLGGIQHKVFNLVLVTIILLVTAYTVIVIYQSENARKLSRENNERQTKSIETISQETMDAVLSESLTQSTQMEAYIAEQVFAELQHEVEALVSYTERFFESPEVFPGMTVTAPDAAAEGELSVQLLAEEGIDPEDPELRSWLEKAGGLSAVMAAVQETAPTDACYIGFPNGILLIADRHAGIKITEDGTPMKVPVRSRPWYTGAMASGGLFFTDVYADIYTGNPGITCSAPVYLDGEPVAVVGADLFLNSMAEAVEASGRNGSFTFLVNERGHVVFSPQTEGTFRRADESAQPDLRSSENTELADFIDMALREATGLQLINVDGEDMYLVGAPIGTLGWTVITAVNKAAADQPSIMMQEEFRRIQDESLKSLITSLSDAKRMIIILLAVILVTSIAAALKLAAKIVKPLGTITRRIAALNGSNLQFMMEPEYRTGDEIEELAEAFAGLSAKTVQYIHQVETVTAEKERIGTELSMATAIQASQLPRLFPPFPNRPEFDLFATMKPAREVGGDFYDFFLVDNDHIGLVMADVSGKGVPAALFMMVSRVLVKSRLQHGESPAEVLENVNNQLCESNESGFFVTVWLALIQISTGKGIAANAGHEHPALCRAGGEFELVVYRHSPAVAAMEEMVFTEHPFELHSGDTLFVYTDGVAEATNADEELFGTKRMLEALNVDPRADTEKITENVLENINGFVGDAPQFDDMTMLCFRYNGPAAKKTVEE